MITYTGSAAADTMTIKGGRIAFYNATTNTDGGILKCGTSSSAVSVTTPDHKFISFYLANAAASGDNRGMYLRLYHTGAGGGGEALRVFTTVSNVAAGTAHGAHISLSFGSTGSITGLGLGMRATLHVPNQAQSGGTYAGAQSEVYFDGTSARIAGATVASIHRFICDGVTSHTNDVPYVFEFVGLNATQVRENTSSDATHGLRCRINGVIYDILLHTAA